MKRLLFLVALDTLLVFAASAAAGGSRRRRRRVHDLERSRAATRSSSTTARRDGSLTPAGSVSAGGLGTGGGLASQGAVTLTDNGRTVLAVNPGSNSVAAFAVRHDGPELLNTAPSGGIRPVSVAVHKQLVYVLNKNNAALATVSGFTLDKHGLTPIAGSTRVSARGRDRRRPGEILAATATCSSSPAAARTRSTRSSSDEDGLLSDLKSFDVAPGATPFGFDFDKKGHLLVSLAGVGGSSGAASYDLGEGRLDLDDHRADRERPARRLLARRFEGRPLRVRRQRRQLVGLHVRRLPRRRAHLRARGHDRRHDRARPRA